MSVIDIRPVLTQPRAAGSEADETADFLSVILPHRSCTGCGQSIPAKWIEALPDIRHCVGCLRIG